MTQQLEDLRKGRLQLHSGAPGQGAPTGPQGAGTGHKGSPLSGPAALELRKLYQELQVNYTLSKHLAFAKQSLRLIEKMCSKCLCLNLVGKTKDTCSSSLSTNTSAAPPNRLSMWEQYVLEAHANKQCNKHCKCHEVILVWYLQWI